MEDVSFLFLFYIHSFFFNILFHYGLSQEVGI